MFDIVVTTLTGGLAGGFSLSLSSMLPLFKYVGTTLTMYNFSWCLGFFLHYILCCSADDLKGLYTIIDVFFISLFLTRYNLLTLEGK